MWNVVEDGAANSENQRGNHTAQNLDAINTPLLTIDSMAILGLRSSC